MGPSCYRLSASPLGALLGAEHVSLHRVEIILPVLRKSPTRIKIEDISRDHLIRTVLNCHLMKNKHQIYVYDYFYVRPVKLNLTSPSRP